MKAEAAAQAEAAASAARRAFVAILPVMAVVAQAALPGSALFVRAITGPLAEALGMTPPAHRARRPEDGRRRPAPRRTLRAAVDRRGDGAAGQDGAAKEIKSLIGADVERVEQVGEAVC